MRNVGPLPAAVSVPVAVAQGGTGAITAAAARTALGLGTAAVAATGDFDAAGAATAAQAAAIVASQPLDADLTAVAAAGNSASLVKIGIAESALNDTAGVLAWNPNTTPFAYYQQDINISAINLTAPTTINQTVTIVLEGGGAFTWANSWTNAVMMAGAWTKPLTGQKNAYTLVSTLTAVGQAIWVQIALAVNLG